MRIRQIEQHKRNNGHIYRRERDIERERLLTKFKERKELEGAVVRTRQNIE